MSLEARPLTHRDVLLRELTFSLGRNKVSRSTSFEHQVRVGRKKHEHPYSSVFYGCSCTNKSLSDTAGLQSVQCVFMQDVALQMVIFCTKFGVSTRFCYRLTFTPSIMSLY